MVKELENAFFMHFSSLPSEHLLSIRNFSFSLELFLTHLLSKTNHVFFCFGQNLFHVIYNHKPRSNGPLKKKHLYISLLDLDLEAFSFHFSFSILRHFHFTFHSRSRFSFHFSLLELPISTLAGHCPVFLAQPLD